VKKEARLHMRVESALLDQIKRLARERGVTVSHLVDQFFRELAVENTRPKADEELGVEQA
jgi:hypothetical protein